MNTNDYPVLDLKVSQYEVTLPTAEECHMMKDIPALEDHSVPAGADEIGIFWTKTADNDERFGTRVIAVNECGESGGDISVECSDDGGEWDDGIFVRPVLHILTDEVRSGIICFPYGIRFNFLGIVWQAFSDDSAIAIDGIARMPFDERTNVWEESSLKTWLDAWVRERQK